MVFSLLIGAIVGLTVLEDEINNCASLPESNSEYGWSDQVVPYTATSFTLKDCSRENVNVVQQEYILVHSSLLYIFIDHCSFHNYAYAGALIRLRNGNAGVYVRHTSFTNLIARSRSMAIASDGFKVCELLDVTFPLSVAASHIWPWPAPGS
jgi:hypothetical protein